jgi:hypothetical protein
VTAFGAAARVGLGVRRRGSGAAFASLEGGAGEADGVRFAGVEEVGEGAADESSSASSRPKESFPRARGICFLFFFLGGPDGESVKGVRALYLVH